MSVDRHRNFLSAAGYPDATIDAMPSDASFRRYFRIRHGNDNFILMDAPPDREKPEQFRVLDLHLRSMGFSAPEILAADTASGLLLLEDFGSGTFTRLLKDGNDETALYELAVDNLAELQNRLEATAVSCPPYDRATLLEEAGRFVFWYFALRTGKPAPDEVYQDWCNAWDRVLDRTPEVENTLVLRDYHVDNLMLLKDRSGVRACGLLDFQDALIGHPAYDLASLLEDARRDVPSDLATTMIERYLAARPRTDRAAFMRGYRVLGAQRHAKIIGLFTRLWLRDGKDRYLGYMQRVMSQFSRSLQHPELIDVKAWLEQNLPSWNDDFQKIDQDEADHLSKAIQTSIENRS